MVILQIEASYGLGSTGIITLDLKKQIEKEGWECYVASPLIREDLRNDPYVYKVGNWFDHKLHAVLSRLYGKQAYYSHIPTLRLIQFIKRINPDVIQFHDLHSNYINLNLLLKYIAKTDIHLVVTLHDCWFFTGGCFHYTSVGCDRWQHECGECPKRYMDTTAYLGDRSKQILNDRVKFFNNIKNLTVVGVSDWIANEFRKSRIKAQRVLTIHNGIDLNTFKPIEFDFKKRLGIEDKFVILGPASKWLQSINKDTLEYFIEKMPTNTVLLLFGCSEKKEDLPDNVIQIAFTRNRVELAGLYSSADVFVNCSREDSLSLINIEAQACGTPVVTYYNTGLKETVSGHYGESIPNGDYKLLFSKTMDLIELSRKDKTTACSVRNWIKQQFDVRSQYNQYVEMYNNLLTVD